MKILFYCQYVWGMGHLFRSIEITRALSNHRVLLVAGGREIDVHFPEHVTPVRLPGLYMDEHFTTLIPENPDKTVEDIQRQRKEILFGLCETHKPDILIIELYPFGRTIFGFELKPLLDAIHQGRFGKTKIVCSLRDILVEKRDPRMYEERVINDLNTHFDQLLIHSDPELMPLDETFSRVNDIQIPVYYTGFVTQKAPPDTGRKLRRDLAMDADEKLIVASAGGGRSGYKLLRSTLEAVHLLSNTQPIRLEMFTGPFRDDDQFKQLSAYATDKIRVRRFTQRFLDYLAAADLSVSLAGYNTCMNLLVTRIPALVYPYLRQREQPIRVTRIKDFLPLKILQDSDLSPAMMAGHIQQMGRISKPIDSVSINLDGAENTAHYLTEWIEGEI